MWPGFQSEEYFLLHNLVLLTNKWATLHGRTVDWEHLLPLLLAAQNHFAGNIHATGLLKQEEFGPLHEMSYHR